FLMTNRLVIDVAAGIANIGASSLFALLGLSISIGLFWRFALAVGVNSCVALVVPTLRSNVKSASSDSGSRAGGSSSRTPLPSHRSLRTVALHLNPARVRFAASRPCRAQASGSFGPATDDDGDGAG